MNLVGPESRPTFHSRPSGLTDRTVRSACRESRGGLLLRLLVPRLILGLGLGLGLGGCRTPEPRFPIGLFGGARIEELPVIAEAGFDLVTGPATPEFLEAARNARLSVLAPPGTTATPGGFDAETASRTVRQFDAHPALRGWLLADEPELSLIPPSALRRAREVLRRAGAHKPVAVTFWNGYLARDYARIPDVLLIDRYPIPRLPLADFAKHLQLARLAADPDRPLFAVVQAFDWAELPVTPPYPGRPGVPAEPLRPPDTRELRAMAYLALVHHAHGLFFYAWRTGRWELSEHPETWTAVREIAAEIRLFEPLFTARRLWLPSTWTSPDRTALRNEALDPSVQACLVEVRHGNDLIPPGSYLVAVNTLDRPVPWRFRAPPGWAGDLGVLHDLGTLRPLRPTRSGKSNPPAPAADQYQDRIPGFGVRVYFPRAAEETLPRGRGDGAGMGERPPGS